MKIASMATLALVVGMGLLLSACGAKDTTTSITTANVTFRSDPPAEVWIDGKAEGSTPVVIAMTKGSHAVALKAEGFVPAHETVTVAPGENITLDAALALEGNDEQALERLTSSLGISHEKLAENTTHRGAGDAVATLFWPRKDVRKSALGTYRVVVTDAYEADGFIEFHKGRKVLHREPFDPAGFTTEKALPAPVIEALKGGTQVTWGVYYDSKRRKDITTKFKVVRNAKADRALKKLERRKLYQRATPLMKEMAKIDVLKNHRLYSEALVASLSVLNTWPETSMPYAGIVDVLTRLKLKETDLYNFAAKKRGGGGGRRAPGSGAAIGGAGSAPGTGRMDSVQGNRRTAQDDLPPSGVAPRVRVQTGATALRAGGSMTVIPTPASEERQPGPIRPSADAAAAGSGAAPADPRSRLDQEQELRRQVESLSQDLGTRQAELAEITQAEAQLEETNQALNDAQDQARSAQDAARLADDALAKKEADGAPQAELDAAREAAAAAHRSVEEAQAASLAAGQARDQASAGAEEIRRRIGNEQAAAQRAEAARNALDIARANGPTPPSGNQNPPGSGLPGSTLPGRDPADGTADGEISQAERIEHARLSLDVANQGVVQAQADMEAAQQAEGTARATQEAAQAALGTAEAGSDQAAIDAATQAARLADAELQRAEMDVERANAATENAARHVEETQELLHREETPVPSKPEPKK